MNAVLSIEEEHSAYLAQEQKEQTTPSYPFFKSSNNPVMKACCYLNVLPKFHV
jgi:hypothetical protein